MRHHPFRPGKSRGCSKGQLFFFSPHGKGEKSLAGLGRKAGESGVCACIQCISGIFIVLPRKILYNSLGALYEKTLTPLRYSS